MINLHSAIPANAGVWNGGWVANLYLWTDSVSNLHDFFRLNVGFIIHETIGYSRDFPFETAVVHLPPELELTDLDGVVRVTRTAQGLLVQVKMAAKTAAECVRCLEDFNQPLEIDFTELYAFTPSSVTESGLLVPENGKIDLEPLVREEMLLAVPISPVCRPGCRGLCPVCGENLNQVHCQHEQEEIDIRLEALKALLEKGESSPSG
jgi:uncharacterized protein